MAQQTHVALLLLVVCISNQLMARGYQTGGRLDGDSGTETDAVALRREGRNPRHATLQAFKGRFATKDKSQCMWAATGRDQFVLSVTCKKEDRVLGCEYVARPASCAQYSSNVQLYWKQIARSLKKQRRLCQDAGALVRTGLCRQAPREAHFKLGQGTDANNSAASPPSPPSPLPTAVQSCQRHNRKLAEEHCNTSWMSFCTFFFTVIQNGDC